MTYHFFVAYLDSLLLESFRKLLLSFYVMPTAFRAKLKVVPFRVFLLIKNIFARSFPSSLQMKLFFGIISSFSD